jgi:6-phospho-beta-glucosidase
VLYYVDRERVEMIARLAREVVRRDVGFLRVAVARTPEELVGGATFVLNSVRVGGIETRAHDECAAIHCGYPGQETSRAQEESPRVSARFRWRLNRRVW